MMHGDLSGDDSQSSITTPECGCETFEFGLASALSLASTTAAMYAGAAATVVVQAVCQ